jgi:hypothetical protein
MRRTRRVSAGASSSAAAKQMAQVMETMGIRRRLARKKARSIGACLLACSGCAVVVVVEVRRGFLYISRCGGEVHWDPNFLSFSNTRGRQIHTTQTPGECNSRGRAYLPDTIKEAARRRHPERPHPPARCHQRLSVSQSTPRIRRRSSPAAPTPCVSQSATIRHATPRLSPKSKSHAHPARGGHFSSSIYRQEWLLLVFSFQSYNFPPPCFKKTPCRHFFYFPLFVQITRKCD